jgi:hypothetical protein
MLLGAINDSFDDDEVLENGKRLSNISTSFNTLSLY